MTKEPPLALAWLQPEEASDRLLAGFLTSFSSDPLALRDCGVTIKSSNLLIGTSGWSYRSWRGRFFPRDLPERRQLEFYAQQFPTTELNGVFYRTPTVETVRAWEERTPEDFVFAWKASKSIMHWKRLSDTSRNSLALLEDRLRLLDKKQDRCRFSFRRNTRKTASASLHS